MKKSNRVVRTMSVAIAVIGALALALLAGCGGGGGGGGGTSLTTGSIEGWAVDASTSIGVGGATVSVGSLQTTTASDGRFTLDNVPAGSVIVVATKASQSLSGQVTTTVIAGGKVTVNIPMLDAGPPPPPL